MAETKVTKDEMNLQIQTVANSGNAGGIWSYINLGGIKMAWIGTANLASSSGGGTNWNFVPPPGFFTTVSSIQSTGVNQTIAGEQWVNIANTPNSNPIVARSLCQNSASGATQGISLFLVGS